MCWQRWVDRHTLSNIVYVYVHTPYSGSGCKAFLVSERLPQGRNCSCCDSFEALFLDPEPLQVLNGGKVAPDDHLCRPDCLMQFGPYLSCCRATSHSAGGAQERLNNGKVKDVQRLLWLVVLLKLWLEVRDGLAYGTTGSRWASGLEVQPVEVLLFSALSCGGTLPQCLLCSIQAGLLSVRLRSGPVKTLMSVTGPVLVDSSYVYMHKISQSD
ncbi:hypothetical protein CHARACLAT_032474 [Characodon lateralis]|uniref:Uncharacterized protein n=1 Tax=Characodon lateralis TaxID=208331 RepID=A0ABU7EHY3_9TELE|nr:hypothetical protein [Characodon lateralis]